MAVPSDLIVSVSGIRGIVGAGLTPEVAARFAAAFGSTVAGQRVILSRDGRPSGEMLRHAVLAGLLGAGCTVDDIGIAPTPTCGFAVRQLNAAGGIQITASHNPAPWNGLKMFGADGAVLPADAGAVIRGLYESGAFARAGWDGTGGTRVPPDAGADHARAVLDTVSVAAVAGQRFRVLLDANAGAGGPLGLALLADLGCDVIANACEPTGLFVHEPEPIPAHLGDVAPWVKQHECAVGFVLDPDSDRLALIDETGTCVSEECTLALAVKYRLRQQAGAVVVNMSTSRMNEDIARAAGCQFLRAAVGEANVVALMRSASAVIGGEGNGGVIDPRIGWVRDPFVGMALILSLMAEERKPLSQLVAELPQYAMLKTKFTVPRERLASAFAALEAKWSGARADRTDGLRLDGPDWWLHVRGSNTEPVVRVIAEAPTPERAADLCRDAGAVVSG
ncbi:MAG: phosphoglucosamine mutase [Planctomycetes bacterium]|nr:phosphoglucosamine mutase [Planctomycetota bacterium]